MERHIRYISIADCWLLQTRTPAKEIAFWIGLLGAGSVFAANIFQMHTIEFMGDKLWKWDLLKDSEWVFAAVILAACQIIYLADTVYLVKKKAARYLDFATYLNELVFWTIVSIFGFRFSNRTDCADGLNVFACVFNGQLRDGRWPHLWILPVCKLAVDISLFTIFRFVQKRPISHGHGQSIVGILLDVQYLLVSLWIGRHAFTMEARDILAKREFYVARHVLGVLFSVGMTLPIVAVSCVLLAMYDFHRSYWFAALSRLAAGVWCCIAFAIAFVLDASLGDIDASYINVIKGLWITLLAIAASYAIVRVYFKIKAKYDPYLAYSQMKTLPPTERLPVLVASNFIKPVKKPTFDVERQSLGEP